MSPAEPILLTPEEAAKALRIGRTRLYGLLADGTIPSVQIGRSRRVAVRALEDFVRRLHCGDHASDRRHAPVVSDDWHHVARSPSHRSRRRQEPRPPDAEVLPLPFPQLTEET